MSSLPVHLRTVLFCLGDNQLTDKRRLLLAMSHLESLCWELYSQNSLFSRKRRSKPFWRSHWWVWALSDVCLRPRSDTFALAVLTNVYNYWPLLSVVSDLRIIDRCYNVESVYLQNGRFYWFCSLCLWIITTVCRTIRWPSLRKIWTFLLLIDVIKTIHDRQWTSLVL